MGAIRVACQTYTWEMLGDEWQGTVEDILDSIAGAGYEGVEITNTMVGPYAEEPSAFASELEARGLSLAAFAYATDGFTDPGRWEDDLLGARRAIEFVRGFPEPRLGLGGAASPAGDRHTEKLDQAIKFYSEVGRLGLRAGVSVNVHPHSHHGSLLETAQEYGYLLDRLDPELVSFGPDTGHIVRGGQDLLACLQAHIGRITHLHLKDATQDRQWAPLGQGGCDYPAVMRLLEQANYDGWVVAEEESEFARCHGSEAIRRNRDYLRSVGY